MSEKVCFLITLLGDDCLWKVALRLSQDALQGDCIEYPMEPKNRAQLHALLPFDLGDIGPIVAVEKILDIADLG
jgi:hypothetical protein